MTTLTQAITLLAVELPKLRAATAQEDLKAWKEGPLREAWRAAAKAHHPDRAKPADREAATKRFAELSAAHDKLQALDVRVTATSAGGVAEEPTAAEPATAARPATTVDRHGRVTTTYVDAQGRAHTHVSGPGGGGRSYSGGGYALGGGGFSSFLLGTAPAPRPATVTQVGRSPSGRTFVG